MAVLNSVLYDKIIGISISESEDIFKLGFGNSHLQDAKIEIGRSLLSCGSTLMYGGDLRGDGFTQILFDLVDSYLPNLEDFDKNVLLSYLGWPMDSTLTEDIQASLSEKVKIVFPGLPKDLQKLKPKEYLIPDTPEKYYAWARSMSFMRMEMIKDNDARIVLGGASHGFKGKYPGIVEEVYLSIKSNKPIYLLGAFGGATKDVIDAILGDTPSRLSDDYYIKFKGVKENIQYFNDNKPQNEESISYTELLNFFNKVGISGLNNGLSEDENKTLFKTKHIPEMISLIIKGLVIRFSK